MEAHDYTPSQSMQKSANNPVPHDALARVVKAYQGLHPDVEIELIRVPPGTDSRVWTVTQLTGERAPEIVWTQSFDANRDAGKNWWVNLDPYMAQSLCRGGDAWQRQVVGSVLSSTDRRQGWSRRSHVRRALRPGDHLLLL